MQINCIAQYWTLRKHSIKVTNYYYKIDLGHEDKQMFAYERNE